MVRHFIIISSSYSLGARIAMHYIIDDLEKMKTMQDIVDTIFAQCGDVSLSSHCIKTEDESWESVVQMDAFFKTMRIIYSLDEFMQLIRKDRVLQSLDIAEYILAVRKCTHLELQKLLYMCYADYLCSSHKELFSDKLLAFPYGPVAELTYEKFQGKRDLQQFSDVMPFQSRILFAEDGIQKKSSIDATLQKYKGVSSTKLVDITHAPGTPWDFAIKTGYRYKEIPDSIILDKHRIEAAR